MSLRTLYILFIILPSICLAQKKASKGDISFFEYSYAKAIKEYERELRNGELTNAQYLNLADSYFKTGNFREAAKIYLGAYKKDTVFSANHFNKLLQSISKTSGPEEVKTFLASNEEELSPELLENAHFNYELLQSKGNKELDYEIFNVSGNSPQADFSPTFYQDKILFASSRAQKSKQIYEPSGEAYLNIYEAKLRPSGDIASPLVFNRLAASNFHKATPYYSAALNSLFYSLSNVEGGELRYSGNGKNAMAIGMSGGADAFKYVLRDLDTSFYYPFYEASTGRLFFAANFEDGYGGTDLYFVYTNDGIIMSAPINLGPRINTPGNEIAPFIFDGSLYFSSDIFYGLGGMDIYRSNLHADLVFSIPVNLGPGINSGEDDFGFIIRDNDTNGLTGYFSSNRKGGKGNDDIYGFNVDEKPGLKTLALKGKVQKPNNGEGIEAAWVRLLDEDGKIIKEVQTLIDGTYEMEVPWLENVVVTVEKDRYSSFSKAYNSDGFAALNASSFDVGLVNIDDILGDVEGQKVIKLNKFYFKKAHAEITPEIAAELDKVAVALKNFPEMQLRIESHTDSRGSNSSNFTLSQKRSDAIKKYLLEQGVPPSNILYSMGFGEEKILNNCKNGVFCLEMLHNVNERSLIVVLNYNLLFN
ncbi:MAG TPA: OmpA family protein [Arenibacter sp.]|nr:OmpA family protein [Arenibacter sp.]